jgi:hypothetical protein
MLKRAFIDMVQEPAESESPRQPGWPLLTPLALSPHIGMCRLFGGGDEMPTNLALDDSLIEEAVKVGNHRTKKEAVTAALQEYVQARKRREILDWVGKVDYYDDYDPKRLRDRKPQ